MSAAPLLWLVIGPNGSGKSTYYDVRLRPHLAIEFVNADRIAAERWSVITHRREIEAAGLAAERRETLLREGRSFVAESVFSHPQKLELMEQARRLGYEIRVTLVAVDSPELSVVRVAQRVERGGHDVPVEKIRSRYARMLPLGARAVRAADRAYVVDNSMIARPLRDVLVFEQGAVTHAGPELPRWVRKTFKTDLRKLRRR